MKRARESERGGTFRAREEVLLKREKVREDSEGMAGLPLPVHTNNRSDLGARAGSLFTLTPSEVRSLLLYVLVPAHSSTHAAVLFL